MGSTMAKLLIKQGKTALSLKEEEMLPLNSRRAPQNMIARVLRFSACPSLCKRQRSEPQKPDLTALLMYGHRMHCIPLRHQRVS